MAGFHGGIASCIEGRGLVFASPAHGPGRSRCRAVHRAACGVSPLPGVHRSLALLG